MQTGVSTDYIRRAWSIPVLSTLQKFHPGDGTGRSSGYIAFLPPSRLFSQRCKGWVISQGGRGGGRGGGARKRASFKKAIVHLTGASAVRKALPFALVPFDSFSNATVAFSFGVSPLDYRSNMKVQSWKVYSVRSTYCVLRIRWMVIGVWAGVGYIGSWSILPRFTRCLRLPAHFGTEILSQAAAPRL